MLYPELLLLRINIVVTFDNLKECVFITFKCSFPLNAHSPSYEYSLFGIFGTKDKSSPINKRQSHKVNFPKRCYCDITVNAIKSVANTAHFYPDSISRTSQVTLTRTGGKKTANRDG